MDAAIPADAQNAPTGIWKSRTEREIPTAPTPIIVVVNERKNNGDSNSVAKPSTESDQAHVTADAAYDTVAVYETAGARGATVVIPPARTANVSGHGPRSPARDRTITWVKTLGRRRWKKASGYHCQGRVENAFPLQVHHRRWPARPESS